MGIIKLDIDGVLCKELEDKTKYNGMTQEEYMQLQPILKNIRKVQYAASKGHFIVLHTARHYVLYDITTQWLKKHSCPYDILICGKPLAHVSIDNANASYKSNWSMKRICDRLERDR